MEVIIQIQEGDVKAMLSGIWRKDPLEVEDYSKPGKKKQYVEQEYQIRMKAARDLELPSGIYLDVPFGSRRKKTILSYLGRAEEEFKDFGLRSVVEEFVDNELLPYEQYNSLDMFFCLRIGAALWILDKLHITGKLEELNGILPDIGEEPDECDLPTDFFHPCYDNFLIRSVVRIIENRYGAKGTGFEESDPQYRKRDSVITVDNAKRKQPDERYKSLLSLLPEKDVQKACATFKEKLWEIVTRYMKGKAYFDKASRRLARQIKSSTLSWAEALLQPRAEGMPGTFDLGHNALSGSRNEGQDAPQTGTGETGLGELAKMMLAPGTGGATELAVLAGMGKMPDGQNMDDLVRRGRKLIKRQNEYIVNYNRYLKMDRKDVMQKSGSKAVADAMDGFTIEDPFELCFALFFLIDTGDDAPWLIRSGSVLMHNVGWMLPWSIDESCDDSEWEEFIDELRYERNGWLERASPPESVDYYHEKCGDKNLAQVIYGLCRCVVPTGFHPFEEERKKLIADGMEENTARKVIDTAELMFLMQFQAGKYGVDEDLEDKEREGENTDGLRGTDAGNFGTDTGEGGADAGNLGTDVGKQGAVVADDELREINRRLDEARKQIKSLRKMLAETKREADSERIKYEREMKAHRREHKELADLRSLFFNKAVGDAQQSEKPEKLYSYPYQTKKRTVVFGGHASFLKAIKPMLPSVRFVDAALLAYNPEVIRNADVVWIQNNCISHPQYWSIVKNCKLADVQMRYFGYASAEKCAEQLVAEDQK